MNLLPLGCSKSRPLSEDLLQQPSQRARGVVRNHTLATEQKERQQMGVLVSPWLAKWNAVCANEPQPTRFYRDAEQVLPRGGPGYPRG